MIGVRVVGASALAVSLDGASAALPAALRTTMHAEGAYFVALVRAHASGRPGPRAITGNYRRSWNYSVAETPKEIVVAAGTNAPQGRRLEYGFNGRDRLGRMYHQPPYPHVQPAMSELEPHLVAAIDAVVKGAIE